MGLVWYHTIHHRGYSYNSGCSTKAEVSIIPLRQPETCKMQPFTYTDDLIGIVKTAVVFGAITVIIYLYLVRSKEANPTTIPALENPPSGGRTEVEGLKSKALQKSSPTRLPPHLSKPSSTITQFDGLNVLSDGIIAFRHTKGSTHEMALSAESQSKNRKDRARVLSSLLAVSNDSVSSPPSKGAILVLAIPVDDIECAKLRRVVYLLATYYNLLVIVSVCSSTKPVDLSSIRLRLRGTLRDHNYIAPDVLPDHRISASSSTAGRVAFVRQLHRIELLIDFDEEVKGSLSRFGHRVILYGGTQKKNCSECSSRLGFALQ